MITVFVGDTAEYLAITANEYNTSAQLISNENYNNLSAGVYYVSIGDLDKLSNFVSVLRQADIIIYSPPEKWSDETNGKSKMQEWTELYLLAFLDKKIIHNFTIDPPENKTTILNLVDSRRTTDGKQLWIVGASTADGSGIKDDERFGQIIANELNLPVSFLTHGGASISWAADQILRSDIRKDDIVVWAIAEVPRFVYFKDNKISHIYAGRYHIQPDLHNKVNSKFLYSQQLLYEAVTRIYQVINFCRIAEARLVLAQLEGRGLENYLLNDCKNFLMLVHQHGYGYPNGDLDFGDDNCHPGPLSHQFYARAILEKLNEKF